MNGQPSYIRGQGAQPVFDDSRSYQDPAIPFVGVDVPDTNTRIRVLSQTARRCGSACLGWAASGVNTAGSARAHGPGALALPGGRVEGGHTLPARYMWWPSKRRNFQTTSPPLGPSGTTSMICADTPSAGCETAVVDEDVAIGQAIDVTEEEGITGRSVDDGAVLPQLANGAVVVVDLIVHSTAVGGLAC